MAISKIAKKVATTYSLFRTGNNSKKDILGRFFKILFISRRREETLISFVVTFVFNGFDSFFLSKYFLNASTKSSKVISEDKTSESMYKISVTKTENAELANTNLETLAIENVLLNPPFYTNITNYEIEISNDTTSLNILAVPENEQGTIQIIGYENLQEGNNLISVIVTAPNGITTREYTINAYKRNQEEEQAYLEEQKGRLEKLEEAYDIEMNSETNEEGTNSENNENTNTNNNTIIYIVLAVIGIIIIIGIVYYIFKKNKNIEK